MPPPSGSKLLWSSLSALAYFLLPRASILLFFRLSLTPQGLCAHTLSEGAELAHLLQGCSLILPSLGHPHPTFCLRFVSSMALLFLEMTLGDFFCHFLLLCPMPARVPPSCAASPMAVPRLCEQCPAYEETVWCRGRRRDMRICTYMWVQGFCVVGRL